MRSMDEIAKAVAFRYNADAIQRIIYSESHDEDANGKARIPNEIDSGDTAGYFARKTLDAGGRPGPHHAGHSMLFEGQEFLEDGWFRDDKALDWSKLKKFHGINRLYHDLISLRRNLHANTRGLLGPFVNVHHVNNVDKVIAFHRWSEGGPKDDVIVAASFSHRTLQTVIASACPIPAAGSSASIRIGKATAPISTTSANRTARSSRIRNHATVATSAASSRFLRMDFSS